MKHLRSYLCIVEAESKTTPVNKFLDAFYEQTTAHPFIGRQRIFGNIGLVELYPDVDDRARAIHISDIMSLSAGRREGHGSETLKFLIDLADQFGVKLTLTAKAYATGPGSQNFPKTKVLVDWYKRYGFRGRAEHMVRRPEQSSRLGAQ